MVFLLATLARFDYSEEKENIYTYTHTQINKGLALMWRAAQSNHRALCPDFKFIQPGRWLLLTLQSATNDLTTVCVCVCVFAKSVPEYT